MHSYSELIAPMKLFSNLFKKLFLQIKKHLGLAKPTATEDLYKMFDMRKRTSAGNKLAFAHRELGALPLQHTTH